MDPTMVVQPGASGGMMNCPPMGQMDDVGGGMMGGCPCMQMHQMMSSSPVGWVMAIVAILLVVSAIVVLVSLSVFLIRRSRIATT